MDKLRERAEELTIIIDAIRRIRTSDAWVTINQNIFNKEVLESIDKLKSENDPIEVYRVQGFLRAFDTVLNLDSRLQLLENEYLKIKTLLNNN